MLVQHWPNIVILGQCWPVSCIGWDATCYTGPTACKIVLHPNCTTRTCCQHVVHFVDMCQDGRRRGSANFDFGMFI